jgi:hypothetical protein
MAAAANAIPVACGFLNICDSSPDSPSSVIGDNAAVHRADWCGEVHLPTHPTTGTESRVDSREFPRPDVHGLERISHETVQAIVEGDTGVASNVEHPVRDQWIAPIVGLGPRVGIKR